MKNSYYLKSVLALVLFAASFFSFQVKAEAVVIEGVAYDVFDAEAKTAQVVALPDGVKYTGTVTIAANVTIGGESYVVKKIGDASMRASGENAASENLTRVIIPEGLEIIGNSSLADCSIDSIQLPASLKSIEDWAFSGCTSLTSIIIPEGITEIKGCVFLGCSSLKTITIPKSVTKIGAWTFQKTGLEEVYVSWASQDNVSIDYWAFGEDNERPNYVWKVHFLLAGGYDSNWWYRDVKLYANAGDLIVSEGIAYRVMDAEAKTAEVVALPKESDDAPQERYTGTLTIAANVALTYRFRGDNSSEEVLETYAVKKIGDGSLRDAPELLEVIIPEGLEIIGNSSFASCKAITSLELPASLKSIEDWAFYECIGLTSLELPVSVNNIGHWVFHKCTNLTSINIPDGITAINEHTFQEAGLTSIELPASVTSLKTCAFQNAKITAIDLSNIRELGDWSLAGTLITEATIENGTQVGGCVFNGCPELTTVILPDSITTIGGWAFQNCAKLTTITIPEEVTLIDGGAFSGCSALTTLTIPGSVNEIREWALEKTGLKEVHISWGALTDVTFQSVKVFGEGDGKSNFTWVVAQDLMSVYPAIWWSIPVTVTLAEDSVLYAGVAYRILDTEAKTAEVIALPDGVKYTGTVTIADTVVMNGENYAVKKIGDNSLRDAPELLEVIIPEGLEIIGNSSFASCVAITSLELPASLKSIEDWAFYGCNNLTSINIPDGITAINEHTFQDVGLTSIELPASVTSLKTCAFQNAKITAIDLSNITELGDWSLAGTLITEANLGNLTEIKACVFNGCPELTTVNIPAGVVAIGDWAFSNCAKLANINLPTSLATIGGGVFSGCSALTTLTIPNSVTSIKDWALEKMTALEEIYISWGALTDVTFESVKVFGEGEGKSNFTWIVTEDLLDVYPDIWWSYPVSLRVGITDILDTTTRLITENQALRIAGSRNLTGTVDVYSVNGVKLYTHNGLIDNTIIALPAGVYVVKIASPAGVMTSKAIVK